MQIEVGVGNIIDLNFLNRVNEAMKLTGLKTDYTLRLKPNSKRFEGRYNPNTAVATIYGYLDDFDRFVRALVHESVHHEQWSDDNFNRKKGVMHDKEFNIKYRRALAKIQHLANDEMVLLEYTKGRI